MKWSSKAGLWILIIAFVTLAPKCHYDKKIDQLNEIYDLLNMVKDQDYDQAVKTYENSPSDLGVYYQINLMRRISPILQQYGLPDKNDFYLDTTAFPPPYEGEIKISVRYDQNVINDEFKEVKILFSVTRSAPYGISIIYVSIKRQKMEPLVIPEELLKK